MYNKCCWRNYWFENYKNNNFDIAENADIHIIDE